MGIFSGRKDKGKMGKMCFDCVRYEFLRWCEFVVCW